jgi:ABC-type polysaccharide/polyol phosphate transport system ATPase subunit
VISPTVSAHEVGVRFLFDSQRRVVTPTLARLRRRGPGVWGIHDVTFSFAPGDAVAFVGPSGSGKTTLLRAIAGVLVPDAGRLEVRGRVASLLSVDAGLTPMLTGRENAMLLGVLAGLPRRIARESLDQLRAWTALDDAFDRPVSSYSQGMRARLSLGVALLTEPSVLLLDEVHEALDHDFRDIVEHEAHALLERGGVVVAAGHDHPLLERLCTRALLMREGTVTADGSFDEVRRSYVP